MRSGRPLFCTGCRARSLCSPVRVFALVHWPLRPHLVWRFQVRSQGAAHLPRAPRPRARPACAHRFGPTPRLTLAHTPCVSALHRYPLSTHVLSRYAHRHPHLPTTCRPCSPPPIGINLPLPPCRAALSLQPTPRFSLLYGLGISRPGFRSVWTNAP